MSPRFTPGSPAAVPERVAVVVAAQERDGYRALTGAYGLLDLEKARSQGLAGIVLEMKETAKGWKVRDLCTGEFWLWPFKAGCTVCYAKNVECKRGYLGEHYYPAKKGSSNRFVPCSNRAFVGTKLEEYEW